MKIGNIVSTSKINVSEVFNVVKSLDEVIQGLPTLIIGWKFVVRNYPNYDIINRQLTNDIYWTFKTSEKRDLFEEDLLAFTNLCYNSLIKDIKYIFVDPLQFGRKKLLKIVKKIFSLKKSTSYFYGDMMYIYSEYILFGIDFKLLKYLGCNIPKILQKIKMISNSFLTDSEILIEYKEHIKHLNEKVKYVPYLYSLTHE